MSRVPPVVLVFAGADPTGGAGIAADIETLSAFGVHAAPVITAITAQDTTELKQFTVTDPELVIAQARAVLEDMPVAAVKTGMLGGSANLAAIATILDDYPDLPLVIDPVLTTGAGTALSVDDILNAYRSLLIPRATLITPNSNEARVLAPDADDLDACAQQILSMGADYVLITGTHEPQPMINHRLYGNRRLIENIEQPRLPHDFHGSGCTLAAACAAGLALGAEVPVAVGEALRFTHATLAAGSRLGMGQHLPYRFFELKR